MQDDSHVFCGLYRRGVAPSANAGEELGALQYLEATRLRVLHNPGSQYLRSIILVTIIKLTDPANRTWAGTHGYGDKVLDYEGVGNSISCRMNVRGTFQAFPHVILLTFTALS